MVRFIFALFLTLSCAHASALFTEYFWKNLQNVATAETLPKLTATRAILNALKDPDEIVEEFKSTFDPSEPLFELLLPKYPNIAFVLFHDHPDQSIRDRITKAMREEVSNLPPFFVNFIATHQMEDLLQKSFLKINWEDAQNLNNIAYFAGHIFTQEWMKRLILDPQGDIKMSSSNVLEKFSTLTQQGIYPSGDVLINLAEVLKSSTLSELEQRDFFTRLFNLYEKDPNFSNKVLDFARSDYFYLLSPNSFFLDKKLLIDTNILKIVQIFFTVQSLKNQRSDLARPFLSDTYAFVDSNFLWNVAKGLDVDIPEQWDALLTLQKNCTIDLQQKYNNVTPVFISDMLDTLKEARKEQGFFSVNYNTTKKIIRLIQAFQRSGENLDLYYWKQLLFYPYGDRQTLDSHLFSAVLAHGLITPALFQEIITQNGDNAIIQNLGYLGGIIGDIQEHNPKFKEEHPELDALLDIYVQKAKITDYNPNRFDSKESIEAFLDQVIQSFKEDDKAINPSFYKQVKSILTEENFKKALELGISPEAIADYFTLRTVEKDAALNQTLRFMRGKDLDVPIENIKTRINHNFEQGYLKDLSDLYAEKTWKGHSISHTPKPDAYVYNLPVQNASFEISNPDDASVIEVLNYAFYPPKSGQPPQTIVIDVYGGHTKSSCIKDFSRPLQDTMMTAKVELGDCESDVFQANQLTEENFKKTHAHYLYKMGAFIKHLRTQYPEAKIFLSGASFGGFFVTSYAFLSTDFNNHSQQKYKSFAQDGFDSFYHFWEDSHLLFPPVDGIISHAGAINYMGKILNDPASLSLIKTPMLMHYNHDDERVPYYEVAPFLPHFDPQYLRFILSRCGAADFMGEDAPTMRNIRGHYNNTQSQHEFNTEMLHFIDMVNTGKFEQPCSPLNHAQTLRRLKLATPENPTGTWFTKKDIQQFLSNAGTKNPLENISLPEDLTSEKAYADLKAATSTKRMWQTAQELITAKKRTLDKLPEASEAPSPVVTSGATSSHPAA